MTEEANEREGEKEAFAKIICFTIPPCGTEAKNPQIITNSLLLMVFLHLITGLKPKEDWAGVSHRAGRVAIRRPEKFLLQFIRIVRGQLR